MKRALRVDKMTLAALESVLQLYANPQAGEGTNCPSCARSRVRSLSWKHLLRAFCRTSLASSMGKQTPRSIQCASQIGSGSLPVESLPSAGIAIASTGKNKTSAVQIIAKAFRALPVPVIGASKTALF
jgi:L-seryl-tRNA(Ser) seleniumtransferase